MNSNDYNYIDLRGLSCPIPILKIKKHIQQMVYGELLHIKATDSMIKIDLPIFCHETGNELLSIDEVNEEIICIILIKNLGS